MEGWELAFMKYVQSAGIMRRGATRVISSSPPKAHFAEKTGSERSDSSPELTQRVVRPKAALGLALFQSLCSFHYTTWRLKLQILRQGPGIKEATV